MGMEGGHTKASRRASSTTPLPTSATLEKSCRVRLEEKSPPMVGLVEAFQGKDPEPKKGGGAGAAARSASGCRVEPAKGPLCPPVAIRKSDPASVSMNTTLTLTVKPNGGARVRK